MTCVSSNDSYATSSTMQSATTSRTVASRSLPTSVAGAPYSSSPTADQFVPADDIERLLQPFQRAGTDRINHGQGIGLGLSIVRAIVTAHHANLTLSPRPHGGLRIEVSFPAPTRQNKRLPHKVTDPDPASRQQSGRSESSGSASVSGSGR